MNKAGNNDKSASKNSVQEVRESLKPKNLLTDQQANQKFEEPPYIDKGQKTEEQQAQGRIKIQIHPQTKLQVDLKTYFYNNVGKNISNIQASTLNQLNYAQQISASSSVQNKVRILKYWKYGQKKPKYISQDHLQKSIQLQLRNSANNQLTTSKYQQDIYQQKQVFEQPSQILSLKFLQYSPKKCKHCHKFGHFQRTCLQEPSLKCYNCLQSHHYNQCSSQVCYRCGQLYHIQKCLKDEQRCLRCRKIGHTAENCGCVLLSSHSGHYLNVINNEYLYGRCLRMDFQRVRCLNHPNQIYGHANCRRNNQPYMIAQVYHTLIWPNYSTSQFIQMIPSIYQSDCTYPFK